MSSLTAKQTFMESCLNRLFGKLNQELTKLEKMNGEKETFQPIIERMISTSIVKIHEKIAISFPKSSIYFQDTTDFIPEEDADGSSFMVIPLGGLENLTHGYEEAFVAMAFVNAEGVVMDAVVYNPFTEESYYASKNNGAFSLHARLRVSKRKETCDIVSYTNKDLADKKDFKKVLDITIEELKANNPIKVSQASILDMILVASGKKDAFIAAGLSKQEVLITQLFAKESGAVVTDFKSQPVSENKTSIIMSNSKLHAKLLKKLTI
ncbi:MAG: hypothetical protein GY793_06955 [Proteobacteria bacterium]|nr:hypothetical protein [Pseudomonadota bacterium]